MGTDSLQDLNLAGIRWELDEKPSLEPQENMNVKKESSARAIHESSIIPAVAPISSGAAENVVKKINCLSELISAIRQFDHPLSHFAKQVVPPHFPNTNSKKQLLVITDSPSNDDDNNGKILTGGAGDLFDKMLSSIGFARDNISILPLVFWHTPGGRTPARDEMDLTRPFIDHAVSILEPSAILTLGTITAAEITGARLPKNHGEVMETKNGIPVISIYHPNYLLLKPDTKKDVWTALQKLQNLLKTGER